MPWSRTHVAFRDHLEQKQWQAPRIPGHTAQRRQSRPPIRASASDEPPFTRAELIQSIASAKRGKAPGPDGLVNAIVQLLDWEGEEKLLQLYNKAWMGGQQPESWSHATVVSIYKGKGDDSDPSSYRPISLLNVTYKIYASMVQTRLAASFDGKLRASQFGFRGGKGTRHPLFILRRAMEWATMTNKDLHLVSGLEASI